MSLLSRRLLRGDSKLVRLPSRPGESQATEGTSCPSSPAIKKVFRLVVVGSSRTGKTALVNRFLKDEFEERYIPTIENFHRKLYKIKGEIYQLDILDCSGNDPFPASRKLSYIAGDMFIIVGAVDRSESIEQMIEIRNQVVECKTARVGVLADTIPILFAVNKIDLPSSKWQIDLTEARRRIASAVEGLPNVCECSAATPTNIEKVFGLLFSIAKLPKCMNPELHKVLRNELSLDGLIDGDKKRILERMRSRFSKEEDDVCYTDVNARRPSLRTDLLLNRTKKASVHTARPIEIDKKCTIS